MNQSNLICLTFYHPSLGLKNVLLCNIEMLKFIYRKSTACANSAILI